VAWGLIVIGSVLLLLFALRYFVFGEEAYFPRQHEVYEAHAFWLLLHIGAMIFATALGPFQFLRFFRNRHLSLHRSMGKVYLVAGSIGAVGGLYMAQYSASGIVSDVAFALLAIGVLTTGLMAYLNIRRGNVQEHREWITRNYSLILAAVTLRIYTAPLEALFGEWTGYAMVAWLCWVPNLLVAEWIIRANLRKRPEPPRRARPAPVIA